MISRSDFDSNYLRATGAADRYDTIRYLVRAARANRYFSRICPRAVTIDNWCPVCSARRPQQLPNTMLVFQARHDCLPCQNATLRSLAFAAAFLCGILGLLSGVGTLHCTSCYVSVCHFKGASPCMCCTHVLFTMSS